MDEKAIRFGAPYGSGCRRNMITYRKSDVICQGTIEFCRRFLLGDRIADRMTRAARSYKQNIEDVWASNDLTKRTEIKLCKTAYATLDELLEDYYAYLKSHNEEEWLPFSKRKVAARAFAVRHADWSEWQRLFETWTAEMACNMMIMLIQQTKGLVHRLTIQWQEDVCRFGSIRTRKPAERSVETRKNWQRSVYRCLSTAETPQELAIRMAEIRELIVRSAFPIRRRKGWR